MCPLKSHWRQKEGRRRKQGGIMAKTRCKDFEKWVFPPTWEVDEEGQKSWKWWERLMNGGPEAIMFNISASCVTVSYFIKRTPVYAVTGGLASPPVESVTPPQKKNLNTLLLHMLQMTDKGLQSSTSDTHLLRKHLKVLQIYQMWFSWK